MFWEEIKYDLEYYIINYISSMDNYIFKEQKSYIIITILAYDFFYSDL